MYVSENCSKLEDCTVRVHECTKANICPLPGTWDGSRYCSDSTTASRITLFSLQRTCSTLIRSVGVNMLFCASYFSAWAWAESECSVHADLVDECHAACKGYEKGDQTDSPSGVFVERKILSSRTTLSKAKINVSLAGRLLAGHDAISLEAPFYVIDSDGLFVPGSKGSMYAICSTTQLSGKCSPYFYTRRNQWLGCARHNNPKCRGAIVAGYPVASERAIFLTKDEIATYLWTSDVHPINATLWNRRKASRLRLSEKLIDDFHGELLEEQRDDMVWSPFSFKGVVGLMRVPYAYLPTNSMYAIGFNTPIVNCVHNFHEYPCEVVQIADAWIGCDAGCVMHLPRSKKIGLSFLIP